jgi:hypothetical protein
MEMITISPTEYREFLRWKSERKAPTATSDTAARLKTLRNAGFGMFKDAFGKTSSVAYVNRIRKAWR